MSYPEYVAMAYGVFVVVLLWDFIAPRVQLHQYLRQARQRLERRQRHVSLSGNAATLNEKLVK